MLNNFGLSSISTLGLLATVKTLCSILLDANDLSSTFVRPGGCLESAEALGSEQISSCFPNSDNLDN